MRGSCLCGTWQYTTWSYCGISWKLGMTPSLQVNVCPGSKPMLQKSVKPAARSITITSILSRLSCPVPVIKAMCFTHVLSLFQVSSLPVYVYLPICVLPAPLQSLKPVSNYLHLPPVYINLPTSSCSVPDFHVPNPGKSDLLVFPHDHRFSLLLYLASLSAP